MSIPTAKQIPSPLIALVSDLVAQAETHASLNSLFLYAEAVGEPPEGSKPVKAQEWLRNTNKQARSVKVNGVDQPYGLMFLLPNLANLANLPGLPATAFPVGMSSQGLPLGAQAMGPMLGRYEDAGFCASAGARDWDKGASSAA